MGLTMLFMYGQALAGLPAPVPGTTVSVVAEDLRTIYARGVVEEGRLVFDAPLPAGMSVQLLFYPPQGEEAVAPQGLQSLRVSVAADGQDLVVLDGGGTTSFKEWLKQQHGLELVLPGQ